MNNIQTLYWLIYCLLGIMLYSPHVRAESLGFESAVILQYHHVADDMPESTSVSPAVFKQHLNWLEQNNFSILPLNKTIAALKQKQSLPNNKNVIITFDDANRSVCDIAWPILKANRIPFTLFISTSAIENGYESQCDWKTLKAMVHSGLMTPGNHSHEHGHMISKNFSDASNWRTAVLSDIEKANRILHDKLGVAPKIFAYPYGEFNEAFAKLITQLGFIGFGQHSGAIGFKSDYSALPRIPASGSHARLDTLGVKLFSLPFPAKVTTRTQNPIPLNSQNNPPDMLLTPIDTQTLSKTRCYNALGEALIHTHKENRLRIHAKEKLSLGRHRYTCTSPSSTAQRYYWMSHQWLVDP